MQSDEVGGRMTRRFVFNPTIARITLHGLLGRRRFLLLIPLPLIMVGAAALGRASHVDAHRWADAVLIGLGFAVMLPLISLIVGTGVLGAEIDDGTVTHILAKPLPRSEIVVTKLVVAAAVTTVAAAPAMLLAGLLVSGARLGAGLAAGAAVGAIAYSALFLALSVVSRRAVIIGGLYILVWEGVLSNLLSGARVLAVEQYAISIAARIGGTDLLRGTVSVPVAAAMAAVLLVAATVFATDRLRSFKVAGETG